MQGQPAASSRQTVSVFLGGAVAMGHSGLTEQDVTQDDTYSSALDWGGLSGSYGVQYTYNVHPRWALGLEYNGNNFDDATQTRGVLLPPFALWEQDIDSRMDVHNFLAVGRFTFNPDSSFRFYVPFGAGIARSKATVEVRETNLLPADFKYSKFTGRDTSFAYYLGLGMEKFFSSHWAWGVEMRYQGFWFDNGKYNLQDVNSTQHHGYISGLLKLSYSF